MVQEATLRDLDCILDVHSQARAAYYGDDGIPLDSIRNPAVEQEQRVGWTKAIQSSDKRVLCAVADDKVVGIAAMGPPLASGIDARVVGQLYQIHVVPGRWRSGVGSTLHASFVAYLAEASLRVGLLEVWERNVRAQGFYAKHGWKPDGRRRPGGPDNSEYIYLRLEAEIPPTFVGHTRGTRQRETSSSDE
ncbi:GNAT family N-acetyltransferase [Micromonospora sp. C28ISP2-4]|nr:GNAT family N-acetyltransferase [Micromonospora sp. C28ISP2-4]MDO3684356.1 GNAT family N-acetyltransferase [Micromonospora sp. C28ISP2-4]